MLNVHFGLMPDSAKFFRNRKDISIFECGPDPGSPLNPSPYLGGTCSRDPAHSLSSIACHALTEQVRHTRCAHNSLHSLHCIDNSIHIIWQGHNIRHEVSSTCRRCAAGCQPYAECTGTHSRTRRASRFGAHRFMRPVLYNTPPRRSL